MMTIDNVPMVIAGVATLLAMAAAAAAAVFALRARRSVGGFGEQLESLASRVSGIDGWDARLLTLQKQGKNLVARVDDLDRDTEEGMEALARLRSSVTAIEERLGVLDGCVKQVFEEKVDEAFRALDGTMAGVLGEMKDGLLHGVSRIEGLEAIVADRGRVQERLLEGLPYELEAVTETVEIEESDAAEVTSEMQAVH